MFLYVLYHTSMSQNRHSAQDTRLIITAGWFVRSGSSLGGGQHGRGENFYMDDVNCDGSEPHVLRCPYPGWGVHNCGAGEVVSVSCSDP